MSPDDPSINTQNIESLWSHANKKLKEQYGTHSDLLEGYLYEFIVRKKVKIKKLNFFNEFLLIIGKYLFIDLN